MPFHRSLEQRYCRMALQPLNDPGVKQEISSFTAELRKDPEKLRAWHVKSGMLTPGGKLTKTYGG